MEKLNLRDYSLQAVINDITTDIECMELVNDLQDRILEWKADYLNGKIGKRYASKDRRVELITPELASVIAVNLIRSILLATDDTFQSVVMSLASSVHILDTESDIKTCAEIVSYCDGVLYDIHKSNFKEYGIYKIEPLILLDDDTLARLNRTLFVPPVLDNEYDSWTTNSNGGYEFAHYHAVLGDKFNRHNKPLNLSVLNILQRVKYRLIDDIIDTAEQPDESWDADTIEEFYQQQIQTRSVLENYRGKEFSFIYQYDKRGRVYDKGYDIHIQGNSYRKASLEFAKQAQLTERGKYWLKVDIANAYGLDKLTFDKRVEWVDENIDNILVDIDSYMDKADEPLLFKQAILAYDKGVVQGLPIGHITRLDATCSGVQIASTIMRDKKAMELLNVIGDENRNDFYTYIAERIYDQTKDSELWKGIKDFSEVRSVIKKPIMVYYYNSISKPKEILGEGRELQIFIDTLQSEANGASELQKLINASWSNKKDLNTWILPDGHTSYCPVQKVKESRIEIPEINAKIKFKYTINQANPMENKSLAPNVIHSIDGWVCRMVVAKLDELGIECSPIHDSFGVHPNYCDELRKIYRHLLARLYRENIIDNIISDIVGERVIVDRPAYDKEVDLAIRNNENGYYIC